jgi:hypothetical protein
MKSPSKRSVRPTISTPNDDPDPVGLFPELSAKLEEAYHLGLRAFLRQNLLVEGLAPAVRRSILDVGTAQGRPVSFPLTITVHPRDASGFARVVGELDTFYLPLDYSSDPSLTSLFPEKQPPVRPKRPRGNRRRKLRPWTGPTGSLFAK